MSEDSVVAHVGGNPVAELPKDLHIPPEALRVFIELFEGCLLYTSPSPRDRVLSRMPSSA